MSVLARNQMAACAPSAARPAAAAARPLAPRAPARGTSNAAAPAAKAPAPRRDARAAAAVSVAEPAAAAAVGPSRDTYFTLRHEIVRSHFPTALGVEDFVSRVERALSQFGFNGNNAIAMTNLCRDEVTTILKAEIESVFGSSFNTNGLGGVLTCGVTGMGAGLSHSPVCPEGRERYVFFASPHCAVDEHGELGAISRPNRPGKSCACGAMAASLAQLQSEGLDSNVRVPGVHDPLDPEMSILKQRLARRIQAENMEPANMNLADITSVAERVIADDLEFLISKAVDTSKADYAVVTGVQIHNWSTDLAGANFEFVAPTRAYAVVNGVRTDIDLESVPPLTPRQLNTIAGGVPGLEAGISSAGQSMHTLQSMSASYLTDVICSSELPQPRDYLRGKPNPLNMPGEAKA
ncbi:hypothetical protein Rsub_00990 [Raphidocelis subcapitata]|uniref:Limiting CO2-inducible protein B/C beta carbonyic anhydrase domain-containing protein n=1 Tax=Raphidocelis subcapitata TaxID=307507 RepID=A0A2V0NLI2_9CHLO|nr:hypothetical protein Rsub_00990 [Raphidocelis subcapitata]|eukprot:GBF88278.1 hypothetical protein Rsub_00990 [Raphidocelis subcapitata]